MDVLAVVVWHCSDYMTENVRVEGLISADCFRGCLGRVSHGEDVTQEVLHCTQEAETGRYKLVQDTPNNTPLVTYFLQLQPTS